MVIVVYLVGQWQTFHRRPMLESLAQQALGQAIFLCINPPISIRRVIFQLLRNAALLLAGSRRLSENLYLFTPVVWFPKLGRNWQEKDSKGWKMISRQIQNAINKIVPDSKQIISWIYRPEQIFCLGLARENLAVYECYDKHYLSHIDGREVFGIKELESNLLKKVALIFTTGEGLYEVLRERYPRVYYVPNGVNFELFSTVQNKSLSIAEDLAKIPSPRIGYTGNLSGRIDFGLLEKIAKQNIHWSLVLVGPVELEVRDEVSAFVRRANVHYLGPKPYELIPSYLKGMDVCIIPYKMHKWNDYSNPLKLWEYLAAGKPIVSTKSEEIETLKNIIYIAESEEEFIAAVCDVLRETDMNRIQEGIKMAKEHSWDNLTSHVFNILKEKTMAETHRRGKQ